MSVKTLDHILDGRRSQPSQLIEALQDVQENYGYISEEAIQILSHDLGVPPLLAMSEVLVSSWTRPLASSE